MSAAGSLQLVKNAGTEDVFTFEDGDTSPASAAEWGQIRNGQIELENWNQADVADRVLATNPIRSRVGEGFTNEYLTKAIDNAETFMREKAYPPLGPRPSGKGQVPKQPSPGRKFHAPNSRRPVESNPPGSARRAQSRGLPRHLAG